jgi:hypothetical protein
MMRKALYFYRLADDDFVREFCVAGATDPHQTVRTLAPDGSEQRWDRREEGDLLVFRAPDGYAGSQPLLWAYDRRLQLGEAMPRRELESRALNRISVVV